MPEKKLLRILRFESAVQIVLVISITVALIYYNTFLGLFLMLISVLIMIFSIFKTDKKLELIEAIKEISDKSSLINKDTIKNVPLPLVILNQTGEIIWNNEEFYQIVDEKNIYKKNISQIIYKFKLENVSAQKGLFNISHRNRYYEVNYNRAFDESGEEILILYWIDRTDLNSKIAELQNKSLCIGLIYIDNYEEIFSLSNNIEESACLLEIDKKINLLGNRINGLLEKLDVDKYLIFFENKYMGFLENRKFEILNEVKEIDFGNKMPVTISIGMGANGKDMKETYQYAKSAMDIALGRGGDQAVVKSKEGLDFYGGKSKTVEKRTKVKARVVAHALRELIDHEENIFIMGHKSPDLDCFGAAIGVYRAVKSRGKNAYIVLDGVSSSIKLIYNNLKENYPEYIDYIIAPHEALVSMKGESLCIVVDTHKPSQVESEAVLKKCKRVVVIDHHRRGAEFIENPVLTYVEPYASSTCELVTEILYYISDRIDIQKFEAEALLAGIALDTKHFSLKTGVRTFEAGAFLRRYGADTEIVRKLFRGDLSELKLRAKVIGNARVIAGHFAISRLDEDSKSGILIAAQSADELLNTTGVDASFVLSKVGGDVHISGRSIGDINVQMILEGLGGGGHMNSAGTRIKNSSLEESEALLEKAIYKYTEEGEL